MEFTHDTNNCKFTIPDRPTVKQQLSWYSAAMWRDPAETLARYWEGAKQLIQKWESADLPDFKVDLESVSNPTQANIVIWAALRVKHHMDELEDLPKNS